MRVSFYLVLIIFIASCATKNSLTKGNSDLATLSEWMTGSFSSAEQAAQDSAFYSINLDMRRIWPKQTDAVYLYVEQAVSSKLDAPYRQRIYRVTQESDGRFASEVFEIPNDDRFIQKGNTPKAFNFLTPDSLITREGCTVYLDKLNGQEFSGSTDTDKCKSSLYGASYATSKVQVFSDKIVSWDQGWNEEDEQVWGAEKGGYVFMRVE